jgi:hypothetical protein
VRTHHIPPILPCDISSPSIIQTQKTGAWMRTHIPASRAWTIPLLIFASISSSSFLFPLSIFLKISLSLGVNPSSSYFSTLDLLFFFLRLVRNEIKYQRRRKDNCSPVFPFTEGGLDPAHLNLCRSYGWSRNDS